VSPHTPNLVLEDFMVETRFEFTLPCLGGGHVTGFLAPAEDDLLSESQLGGGRVRSLSGGLC
jgi:hypothetical protein